jgi:hypothetical protein
MTVSFEVPADIAGLIAVESTTLERVALEALAAEGYRCGSISESEVRRLLGFESRFDVHAWLKGFRTDIRRPIWKMTLLPFPGLDSGNGMLVVADTTPLRYLIVMG